MKLDSCHKCHVTTILSAIGYVNESISKWNFLYSVPSEQLQPIVLCTDYSEYRYSFKMIQPLGVAEFGWKAANHLLCLDVTVTLVPPS